MAGPAGSRRRRLGQVLVEHGVLGNDQLTEVLERQKRERGSRLGRLVVELGLATEVQIAEALAAQLQIPATDLAAVDVPNEVLNRVERSLATKHLCLPWFIDGRDLYLVMADPTDIAAADAIAFHTGLRVKPVVAAESEVFAALERFYAAEESSLSQFEHLDLADQLSIVAVAEADLAPEADDGKAAEQAPVVKLVNAILVDAIRQGASDIHIEPHDRAVQLRYRVDGILRNVMTMPKRVHSKVVSRVKVMSHMDIAERRKPQDGRTFIRIGSKSYDFRVSTLPTADGEKIVGRLLLHERAQVNLEEIGFSADVLGTFTELLRRPQGMILVTGPTGSGKTSTLYAALNLVRSEATNIVTIEEPVEFRLPGINQVAVSPKSGLTFAAGLRSILRQDPDIIMVGEIRDLETAQIAFQAAQTGHLVLSTLHTNDAPSAVTRLVEMGLPAYVVASSLVAVLAQRLVLKLCACAARNADGTASPKGCEACRFTGFKGRIGVFELMRVTPRVSSVLVARASNDVVRRAAQATGMRTMYVEGLRKVAQGLTTLEQIRRVVPPDEPDDLGEGTSADGAAEERPRLAIPAPLAQTVRGQRPAHVLVVDDDPQLVEVIRDILEDEHYSVSVAANGREALQQVYRERPDLVLTDLRMPDIDGIELLRRLRRDLSTCQIPVLFLSIVAELDREVEAMDLGADDYITKPVERSRLLSRVRRSLFRAHLAQSVS